MGTFFHKYIRLSLGACGSYKPTCPHLCSSIGPVECICTCVYCIYIYMHHLYYIGFCFLCMQLLSIIYQHPTYSHFIPIAHYDLYVLFKSISMIRCFSHFLGRVPPNKGAPLNLHKAISFQAKAVQVGD